MANCSMPAALLSPLVLVAAPALAAHVPQQRTIARTLTVAAPLVEVWAAWTTDAGVRRFLSSETRIEPRLGGAYEVCFLPENPPGLRGCEGCRVHSFIAPHVLQITWSA